MDGVLQFAELLLRRDEPDLLLWLLHYTKVKRVLQNRTL